MGRADAKTAEGKTGNVEKVARTEKRAEAVLKGNVSLMVLLLFNPVFIKPEFVFSARAN